MGVLFDGLGSPFDLPWNLTVHFQGFPTDQLLRCPSEEVIKRHFNNVLKEVLFRHQVNLNQSNYVKHGDCSKVYGLSVSETNDLWEGLKSSKF